MQVYTSITWWLNFKSGSVECKNYEKCHCPNTYGPRLCKVNMVQKVRCDWGAQYTLSWLFKTNVLILSNFVPSSYFSLKKMKVRFEINRTNSGTSRSLPVNKDHSWQLSQTKQPIVPAYFWQLAKCLLVLVHFPARTTTQIAWKHWFTAVAIKPGKAVTWLVAYILLAAKLSYSNT